MLFMFTGMGLAPLPAASQNGGTPATPINKCWEYNVSSISEIASDNDRLFISQSGARVDAVNASTGQKIWSTELGGEPVSNIAVGDPGLFVVTISNAAEAQKTEFSNLRSLSKDTGITNWSVQLPRSGTAYLGVVQGSIIFASIGGDVAALDRRSGQVLWKRVFPSGLSTQPRFAGDSIVVGLNSKEIVILSPPDGTVRLQTKTEFLPTAVLKAGDNELLWGDQRGNVIAYGIEDKETKWKLKGGAEVSHLSAIDDDLLVTSLDNFVYRVSINSGNVLWKKRQAGRVTNQPVMGTGFAVVITNGERTGHIIDPENGKLLNQLSLTESNDFLRSPVILGSSIVFPTATGLIAYNLSACATK